MALTKVRNRMIEGDVVNVLDFGAVGDGAADDTASIQAAIDAGVGNAVYFPAGEYKVTSSLLLQKAQVLCGPTRGQKTDISASRNAIIKSYQDVSGYSVFNFNTNYARATQMHNLVIEQQKDGSGRRGSAIEIGGIASGSEGLECRLEDLHIIGFSTGIQSDGEVWGLDIIRCFFSGTGAAGMTFSGTSEPNGVTIYHPSFNVLGTDAGYGDGSLLANGLNVSSGHITLIEPRFNPINGIGIAQTGGFIKVFGGYWENCRTHDISMTGSAKAYYAGTEFIHNGNTFNGSGGHIRLRDDAHLNMNGIDWSATTGYAYSDPIFSLEDTSYLVVSGLRMSAFNATSGTVANGGPVYFSPGYGTFRAPQRVEMNINGIDATLCASGASSRDHVLILHDAGNPTSVVQSGYNPSTASAINVDFLTSGSTNLVTGQSWNGSAWSSYL